jgi:formylglycine-generating enzyme required for sulfatase activity
MISPNVSCLAPGALRGLTQAAAGGFARLVAIWAILFALTATALAQPTVSNVRAAQRAGTNLVDVYYDLVDEEARGASISLALSGDGGTSYLLPLTALSGDVGAYVGQGLNRRIVWNAEADLPDYLSTTMRFRVTAGPPPLEGLVLIPAGPFQMGDNFAEYSNDELPVHTVTLSAFYMARTETTKAKWDEGRTWGLANGYTDLPTGDGKGTNHPVGNVSWNDIVKWCNAASERDGMVPVYRTSTGGVHRTGTATPVINYANNGYRLPSEAEWEKAARGGLSGRRFPWGDTITHGQANYNSLSGYAYDVSATRDYHPSYQSGGAPYTSPVGSFGANGYGLYDMAGNVWEWCNDWYGSGYYASSPSSDPRGPTSGSNRLFRGGGWGYYALHCRVAARDGGFPSFHYDDFGFRLARSL